jgi:hypothetical protein
MPTIEEINDCHNCGRVVCEDCLDDHLLGEKHEFGFDGLDASMGLIEILLLNNRFSIHDLLSMDNEHLRLLKGMTEHRYRELIEQLDAFR